MKTKNIFRMLLVAAVMMTVGVNGAKAEDIWNSGPSGDVAISKDAFENVTAGSILQVYTSDGSQLYIGTGNGEALFYTPYNDWIRNGEYYNSTNKCFEFELTQSILIKIQSNGLKLQNYSSSITKVSVIEGSETDSEQENPTPTILVEGTPLWTGSENLGEWNNNASIPVGTFASIAVGDTLRFYGTLGTLDATKYQFKLYDGKWTEMYASGEQTNFNGYLQFIVTDNWVEQLNLTDNYGASAYINGYNLTITTITLLENNSEKYTLTYIIDGEEATMEVAEGATITLPTPSKEGYTFTEWEGLTSDGKMPGEDLTVTAQFSINSYTLTYKVNGEVYGDVETIEYGATITARTEPTREGYTFSGWSDIPETMPADNVEVTGYFAPITEGAVLWSGYGDVGNWSNDIKITEDIFSPINEGDTICVYGFNLGENWQFEIKDGNNSNQFFYMANGYNNWKVVTSDMATNMSNMLNGAYAILRGANYVVTAITLKAKVAPQEYDITIDDNITNGTISIQNGLTNALAGQTITIIATPANEYQLEAILVTDADGNSVAINNNQFTMPASNVTVSATFVEIPKFTVAIDSNIENGTVTADKEEAKAGEIVTITITPDDNYILYILTVTDADGNNITVSNRQFIMPASNVTISATFQEKAYTITASAGLNGSIEIDTNKQYKKDDVVTFTATPENKYELDDISITDADGNAISYTMIGGEYSFIMPASDVTVQVSFKKKPVETISIEIGTSGYATFSSTKAIDLNTLSGVTAYYAKAVSTTEATLAAVTGAVAANTGLLLVGSAGSYSAEVIETGSTISNNLLVAVSQATTINAANKYVLTNESGEVKFADTQAHPAVIPAGKAYLLGPASNGSRMLRISFSDATGIQGIITNSNDNNTIFDMRGMRVKTPAKGLYIINGKKVFIK